MGVETVFMDATWAMTGLGDVAWNWQGYTNCRRYFNTVNSVFNTVNSVARRVAPLVLP